MAWICVRHKVKDWPAFRMGRAFLAHGGGALRFFYF